MKTQHLPSGFTAITPYLIFENTLKAIEFYKQAFMAIEGRIISHNGKVLHADITICGSKLVLADEFPKMGHMSPSKFGGSPIFMHLYVDNVDEFFQAAIAKGCEEIMPVSDQFFGDRHGHLKDPFGYIWTVSSYIRDVTDNEINNALNDYVKNL